MNRKLLMEAIGTMLLAMAAWAGGLAMAVPALIALVYMGGHVSGAHFNPAVTFGLMMGKKIDQGTAIQYWIYQFVGVALAAFILWFITGDKGGAMGNGYSAGGAEGIDLLRAVGAEAFGTFILVFVIMMVAAHPKNTPNQFYGVAIGLALLMGASIASMGSGGSVNPAIGGIGTLMDTIFNSGEIKDIWICLVGPMLGGALAATVYGMIGESED